MFSNDSYSVQHDENKTIANGESIYHSGKSLNGDFISFKGGPHWLQMHGGGCASCHGADGKGGGAPHHCDSKVPPVGYNALFTGDVKDSIDQAEGEHGDASHSHGDENVPHWSYTEKTLRIALETGRHASGNLLNECMPKWELSDANFKDLIEFLRHLDAKPHNH